MIVIQTQDFDVGAAIERLGAGHGGIGAVVSFVGQVREVAEGEALLALELFHYPGMTERVLQGLLDEARLRWPIADGLIIHRVGRLAAGDRIVLVAVASAHRHAAFEACEFLMDALKTRAPFWKKEHTAAGARWVEARVSDQAALNRWDEAARE